MDRTITALYDTREEAEAAKRQLLDQIGAGSAHVEIISQGQAQGDRASSAAHDEGFLEKIKHFFMADEDKHAYSEGMRRGGYLLSARVDEARADQACRLLDETDAVDLEARKQQWAASGWDRQSPGAMQGETGGERIPLAEERFKVGKREVDRGTVRVRSFVEEHPVHEQIDLTEERVEVERRPVDRTLSGAEAEGLFRERTIEMTERGEEAVVAKEAVVTEEIGLRKEADRRTETIDDTVRETRVDVEDGRRDAAQRHDGSGLAGGQERSFASRSGDSQEEHSVAMDPDGASARETEEERLRRLRDEPGGRPTPL